MLIDVPLPLLEGHAFQEHLAKALRAAQSADRELSLVLLDVDDFQHVNDSQGHPVGDQVLRGVARVVLRQIRLGEEAFRVGGEEFAVIVDGSCEDGARLAERVRAAVVEQRREPLPTLSAGVAAFPSQARNADELVRRADMALTAAKDGGKNQVVIFENSTEPR